SARGGSGLSEYQYYEFQAVDRRLTEKEMAELRSVSTRGRITPTSFVNEYSWADFKGDEDAWMEKYFDAFLYLANWGTHVMKLRLPGRLLDAKAAQQYCPRRACVGAGGQRGRHPHVPVRGRGGRLGRGGWSPLVSHFGEGGACPRGPA